MADVDLRGPIFDGRAKAALEAYTRDVEFEVANHGVNVIQTNLDGVLKNPTGHYRSSIRTENASPTRITDGNVVYGNWLEGVSERNRSTRFKGYATFRRSVARIQGDAGRIADAMFQSKYARRIG